MRLPRLGARVSDAARFGMGAALGAASALGRPGGDLLALHLAAFVLLLAGSARASSLPRAVLFALGFGFADGAASSIGGLSWGAIVPVTLTCILTFTHPLPLALWARFASSWPARWRFFGTFCISALLTELSELIGFPTKLATSFVVSLPELVAGARLIGADLITGLLVATCLEVAVVLSKSTLSRKAAQETLRAALPGLLSLGALSILAHLSAPTARTQVQVGIPQINADSTYYLSRLTAPSLAERFDRSFAKLLLPLESSDLLVTPEAYDGRFGLMLPPVREAWAQRSRRLHQAAVVTSYLVDEEGGKRNGAGVFDAEGRLLGIHEKRALAPFGEAPLTAGAEYRVFEVWPNVRLGVVICLESQLRRPGLELVRSGADLLVATTSDVTFGSSILVFEHLAMSQLRAIELGRSLIWASNAGPSGVIGRFGTFEGGPFRETTAIRAVASVYSGKTPYVRFFELWSALPWIGLSVVLVALRRNGTLLTIQKSAQPSPASCDCLSQRKSTTRHALARLFGALGILFAFLAGYASPAWLELRRGSPDRALAAVAELGRAPRVLSAPDPFARFRSSPERSAAGAIAYFLEYHGFPPPQLAELSPWATLDDVQREIARHGVATRAIELSQVEPRAAALLRLRDGTWGVTDSQEAGVLHLVAPHDARSGTVSRRELLELAEATGLIPGN